MRTRYHLLATLALAQAAASGQTLSIIATEGDTAPGVGVLTRIDGVRVADDGTTIVEADTDNPDTSADSVLFRDGALFLTEGQALAMPAGASLGGFDGVGLLPGGAIAFNLFLDDTVSTNDNSGIYRGTDLVLQEGSVSLAAGFSPGTTYRGFFDVKFGADQDTILTMASVDDPLINSTTDRALVLLEFNSTSGLWDETVIAKEGDILPGQIEAVADFETGAEEYAINSAGQVLFTADLAGPTSSDRAIYLDSTLLLQEGSPSIVAGRNWGSLSSPELDLNENGSWVVKTQLDNTDTTNDWVIVRDGNVFMREGDSVPDIGSFTFQDFGGSVGVWVTDDGDVIWFGDWDDPDTSRDEGLFINDRLVLQEGVTVVDGETIIDLSDITEQVHVSPSGDYIIIEGEIAGATSDLDVAILIETDFGETFCTSLPNSTGAVGTLFASGSDEVAANDVTLNAGNMPPGQFGIFVVSPQAGNTSVGDGILCLAGPIGRFNQPGQVLQVDAAGSFSLALDLTAIPTPNAFVPVAAGDILHFQAWHRDGTVMMPLSNFTNGLRIEFE